MKRKVMRNPYRAIYRTALISAAALGVSVVALMGSLAANKDDLIPVAREPLEMVEEPVAEPVELEPMPEPLESLGTFMVQSYCPCIECCGEWSAEHPSRVGTGYVQRTISGTIPEAGRTVGVDPDVIPLGTHILVAGHEYVAEDAGAGKGNIVEIYFDTHAEAMDWPRGEREIYLA